MADVNKSTRKRKGSCSDVVFEINGDDVSPFQSPRRESQEPEAKIARKSDVAENCDSNLSQNSVEINVSIHEKIMELQDENAKLRKQLQEITCLCKCNLSPSSREATDGLTQAKEQASISIKFRDESVAESYKGKFRSFLQSFLELRSDEDRLEITAVKNDVGVNMLCLTPEDNCKTKRKRKKSKSKASRELFIVDTTPSITIKENDVMYTSKYSFTERNEKDEGKCVSLQTCFNCDKHHSLRDCPEPKNFTKINAARNKLKSQQITKARYHLDEDQKYAHLHPGRISQRLRDALNLRVNELPSYIYKMRMCGYPPGWMEDAKVVHSNISLFDMEGKEDVNKKSSVSSVDPERVVEYPGFNIPMENGTKDDYRYHNCYPYSEKCSKKAMLEYIKKNELSVGGSEETCDDVDEDGNTDGVVLLSACEVEKQLLCKEAKSGPISPSLTDLEKKKIELLAALDDSSTLGSLMDDKEKTSDVEELQGKSNVKHDELIILDETNDDVLMIEECHEGSIIEIVSDAPETSKDVIEIINLTPETSVNDDNAISIDLSKDASSSSEPTDASVEKKTCESTKRETNSSKRTANKTDVCNLEKKMTDDKIIQIEINDSLEINETEINDENDKIKADAIEVCEKGLESCEVSEADKIETVNVDEFESQTSENVKIPDADDANLNDCPTATTPVTDNVKKSLFGTPVVKSTSLYSQLPHPEKFSKDISPVINFENLPNSTGKYEQMTGILQKVRKTLKNLQSKS